MIRLFNYKFDIPELTGSDPAVIKPLARMFEAEYRGKNAIAWLHAVQLGSIAFLIVLSFLFVRWVGASALSIFFVVIAISVWVAAMGSYGTRATAKIAAEFVQFVRERCPGGVPLFCLKCNYDLRGSPGGVCPECGAAPVQWERRPITRARPGVVQVKLRGRLYGIPELRGCTEETRMVLVKRFEREHRWRNRVTQTQIAQVIGFVAVIVMSATFAGCMGWALFVVWVIVGGLAGNHATKQLGEDFRAYLRDLCPDGRPRVCPQCDYDLRASPGETCPECGAVVPMLML